MKVQTAALGKNGVTEAGFECNCEVRFARVQGQIRIVTGSLRRCGTHVETDTGGLKDAMLCAIAEWTSAKRKVPKWRVLKSMGLYWIANPDGVLMASGSIESVQEIVAALNAAGAEAVCR